MPPLVFHLGIIIASLAIVIKSADLLVFGITNYARKLGISDYLIGFIVVGIGTSLPEFVSSVMGVTYGDSGIIIGTILGSGVCTLSFLLGMMGIVGKKVNMKAKLLEGRAYLVPVITVLPLFLSIDGTLGRIDGAILVMSYLGYISLLWKKEGTFGKLKKRVYIEHIYKDALVFVGSLIALLLSAKWLVFSSIQLSKMLGISSFIIALTVIAIGASLPDLLVQLKALKTGHSKLGFGNILGGVISEMLLIFGLIALIAPFTVPLNSIIFAGMALFISSVWGILVTRKGYITRMDGIWLVAFYVGFILFEIFGI